MKSSKQDYVCPICKGIFSAAPWKNKKFCSRSCYYLSLRKQRICPICKNALPLGAGSLTVYCSVGCRKQGRKLKMYDYTCGICGSAFSVRQRGRLFCSRACNDVHQRERLKSLREAGLPMRRSFAPVPKYQNTVIEQKTAEALGHLRIISVPQHVIGFYSTDFYLPDLNTVIECQGDYWHCNPVKYPDGPINSIQKYAVARDKAKMTSLTNRGYRVICLWESDIKKVGALALLKAALGTP